jgi:hypothetical protein
MPKSNSNSIRALKVKSQNQYLKYPDELMKIIHKIDLGHCILVKSILSWSGTNKKQYSVKIEADHLHKNLRKTTPLIKIDLILFNKKILI